MKTMADIRRIVDLYELYGSYKKVARELDISLNTAKKYLRRVNDVQGEKLTRSCRRTGRFSSPRASSLKLSARRSTSILSRTSNIPENSDSLPNESGSCSSRTVIKSDTPASKMKWSAGNVPTISRYSLVKCEGNFYSVPDTYRPRLITLKIMVDRIALLDGNDVIASHRRLTGKQQYSLDITHYIKTFHRKPGALPNARVLAQVDELILDLFNRYYLPRP